MERRDCETRYELAAAILPSRLRRIAMELPETDKRRAEEFRLRAGHCLSVLLPASALYAIHPCLISSIFVWHLRLQGFACW